MPDDSYYFKKTHPFDKNRYKCKTCNNRNVNIGSSYNGDMVCQYSYRLITTDNRCASHTFPGPLYNHRNNMLINSSHGYYHNNIFHEVFPCESCKESIVIIDHLCQVNCSCGQYKKQKPFFPKEQTLKGYIKKVYHNFCLIYFDDDEE